MKGFIELENGLYAPDKSLHLPKPSKVELASLPVFGGLVEIGAWDKAGKLIHQLRQPSRSPVKQILQLLLVQMKYSAVTITDISGAGRSSPEHVSNFMCIGAASGTVHGIMIGTDDTAVDITDYALGAQIAHGSGAGQMLHQTQVYDADVTVADPDCTFEAYRNYNNNSGGAITVKETGMYGYCGAGAHACLMVRDVPGDIVVPHGGGCYVLYTLKITE